MVFVCITAITLVSCKLYVFNFVALKVLTYVTYEAQQEEANKIRFDNSSSTTSIMTKRIHVSGHY